MKWHDAFASLLRVVAVAVALQTAAASAAPVTVPDHRGRTLTLPAPPQRIVTLLPSLTESVCALGACARLVGVDRYTNWPDEVKALPRLGGLEDAQIERIVSLRPDVVLAGPSTRAIDRLEGLGLRVLVIQAETHAQVRAALGTLGTLLGTPSRGEALWAGIEKDVAEAARQVPPALRGQKVYFEIDASPYAAGAGSFIGETLALLGMGNVVPAAMGPFPRLNPEYVVKAQPDVVMAEQRSLGTMARRPGWSTLKALQQGRQCGFQGASYDVLIRPGPRLGEAAKLLGQCLRGLGERTAPGAVSETR